MLPALENGLFDTEADTKPQPVVLGSQEVLGRLGEVCANQGIARLAQRLQDLAALVGPDLAQVETQLAALVREDSRVNRSAHHLLELGGKRLRPTCVALAAHLGGGFSSAALDLAVAVEMIHSATLLHDDVVDSGETRRGAPTARRLYGNTASIFAGDWLLVEALRRVRRVAVDESFDDLLDVLDQMVAAETVQLELRGNLSSDRETYFRIVRGKTTSLFRWGLAAGARAGGLGARECASLEAYGHHLGTAFQVVDDVLDVHGNQSTTGKELFKDLREGKLTLPLIIALERDRTIRPLLESAVRVDPEEPLPAAVEREVSSRLVACGAIEACIGVARDGMKRAIDQTAELPQGPALRALITVAEASVHRVK